MPRKLTKEEFIARAKERHGDKYNYDKVEYKGNNEKVMITCQKHGDFPQTPKKHLRGQGCPKCNESHLETVTSILLEKHNIKYEPQKTFPWLKNKRKMHLDFFLPEYNIAIECQGIQHYLEYPTWVFTEEIISDIKQRDSTKHFLCQEYGIPIYYIKYNDNIEEKINELVSKVHEREYR